GAQWIGCRNMDRGVGTPATYIECFQFFLAPTDLAGNNPDPDRAPDVLNNSWRCPTSEGCTNPDVLRAAVENARAAGIVVVASAGNDGPACSSINAPPAIYDAAFTVGATADPSSEDGIDAPARFSSRGPIAVDGSNRLKPDVSAPGQWIRSSDLGGTYRAASGTSLSGPHVTGLVALMIAADPNLAGEVDQIEEQIRSGAAQPATTTNEVCGGIAISSFPNHTYGYGRIDAVASISPVPEFRLSARPSTVETCAPAEAQFTVELARFEGFAEAVTLSAAGAPPGTSALFAANPLTPPASTTLTIGGTGAAAGGVYALTITGTANPSGMERHGEVTLRLFAGPPPPPALSAPANGAANLEQQPLLVWSAIAAATQYQVEVANDAAFADLVYSATTAGTSLGVATPLVKGRRYFWRVRGSNLCGAGTPATAFSFTTRSQARLLLVDEDDGAPDVRPLWEQALQSLGREYDVWNAGGAVLGSADLAPYDTTVWFTGARTGDAGPGSEESAIASWLAAGRRCFFISSRDYFASGRISAFMQNQLGAAEIDSDGSYSAVAGAAPLFGDLGSLPLAPPLGSFGDLITPGARTTTTFAAAGGAAGVRRDAGSYRTHYFAFAWEALDTATRREVLRRVLADCATVTDRLFNDGFESGSTSGWLRP
ncbi:MAG TPA: S8 family serine peptidase, partial [Thermoanaerobaculia bacterium]|nr:S8 family serine peptidase [Thermoanaerobaculia bacterium]